MVRDMRFLCTERCILLYFIYVKTEGTTADKEWKERKLYTIAPPFPRLQTLTAEGQSQLFKM